MLKREANEKGTTVTLRLGAEWVHRTRSRDSADERGIGVPRLSRRRAFAPATALVWRLLARGSEPGSPRGLLLAWPRWEHFAQTRWPTQKIPRARYDVLRVRMVPYEGDSLMLPDGTKVRRGMIVGELHCQNRVMLDLVRSQVSPYRAARDDLRCLARWVSHPCSDVDVQAFFGTTLIGSAAARLGFSVRNRPVTLRRRLDRMFMTGLLLLYTVDGLARLERGVACGSYPQEVWLSRRELLRRYASLSPEQSARVSHRLRENNSGAAPL
jgi:hypothetical protein